MGFEMISSLASWIPIVLIGTGATLLLGATHRHFARNGRNSRGDIVLGYLFVSGMVLMLLAMIWYLGSTV